jgi:predicted GH43/DUF377 family glycosyl hydrolase
MHSAYSVSYGSQIVDDKNGKPGAHMLSQRFDNGERFEAVITPQKQKPAQLAIRETHN